MFSINAPVFFKDIYTILFVFFSFIVICSYFYNISTCTYPKSVLIYNFKVDGVTKSFVHFRSCAFSRTANSQKMREDKMQEILGHYICFFFVESRVLIFQDSRFLFTAKLLRIDMKNLRFNRYTKSRLYLGYSNMTVYTRLTV